MQSYTPSSNGLGGMGNTYYPSIFRIEIKSNDTIQKNPDNSTTKIVDKSPDYEIKIESCSFTNINGGMGAIMQS